MQLDGKRFNKFCKENKLLNKKFNGNACDLLFTSVKTKGQKVITFAQFKDNALPKIAEKLGIPLDAVLAKIGGPKAQERRLSTTSFMMTNRSMVQESMLMEDPAPSITKSRCRTLRTAPKRI